MKLNRCMVFAIAAMLSAPAGAAPATIDDCETIKGVDAYNYCLASFGPKRGQRPPAGSDPANPEDSVPQGQKPGQRIGLHKGGSFHIRNPHSVFLPSKGAGGRMTMQFTVSKRAANAK